MVQSYKYKSKIATIISFAAAFIVYVGKDELAKLLPTEYASLAAGIVILAAYIVAQGTEDKRVEVAEQLAVENNQQEETPEDVQDDTEEDSC